MQTYVVFLLLAGSILGVRASINSNAYGGFALPKTLPCIAVADSDCGIVCLLRARQKVQFLAASRRIQ